MDIKIDNYDTIKESNNMYNINEFNIKKAAKKFVDINEFQIWMNDFDNK
jgi:hypothetical protein